MSFYIHDEGDADHSRKVLSQVAEVATCCMFLIVFMVGIYLTGVASCHEPKPAKKYQERVLTHNR
jgi:hypothetical protein